MEDRWRTGECRECAVQPCVMKCDAYEHVASVDKQIKVKNENEEILGMQQRRYGCDCDDRVIVAHATQKTG